MHEESVRGVLKEADIGVMHFEDGGGPRATGQGIRRPLKDKKGKEMDFPLRAFRRMQLCRHCDFSLVKPILEF